MTDLPKQLVEYIKGGLCIPWCGAGVSIPSGLPGWSKLVNSMLEESKGSLSDKETEELTSLYKNNALEDVVDFARQAMGEAEYRDFLTSVLDQGVPSLLHQRIVQLPTPAVLTTNYDRLLEKAFAQIRADLPKVFTSQDTTTLWKHLAKREFFILKVHGNIVRPDTVVFTTRDYTEHVFGNIPFMTFLQRLILGHSVLFIGTSLTDYYVRRVLEETTYMTGGVGLPHYALLPNPGSIQSRLLRDRYNIRVIPYDPGANGDHQSAILSMLANI